MNFVNCTPHDIVLNNGTTFKPSGTVARVSSYDSLHSYVDGIPFYVQTFGLISDLPDPQDNTFYIVSAMVKAATDRKDVVAPATNNSLTVRSDKGHIVSVPGFIRN